MMINKLFEQKKAVMSFEIFPPKKDANIETVFDTLSALRDLSPDFISITYGAGGSIAENRTVQLCDLVKNKYGITSLWDYRNSPEKQHALQQDYKKNDWKYIKNLKLDKYIGRIINDVEITASGLLAGAHLKGVGGLKTYLESDGKNDVKDRKGTPISRYISQFANYDVSDITN